jgi:hypothetical protein
MVPAGAVGIVGAGGIVGVVGAVGVTGAGGVDPAKAEPGASPEIRSANAWRLIMLIGIPPRPLFRIAALRSTHLTVSHG